MSQRTATIYICDVCGDVTEHLNDHKEHQKAKFFGLNLEGGMVFQRESNDRYAVISHTPQSIKSEIISSWMIAKADSAQQERCWRPLYDYYRKGKRRSPAHTYYLPLVHTCYTHMIYFRMKSDGKIVSESLRDSNHLEAQMYLKELTVREFDRVIDAFKDSGYAMSKRGKPYLRYGFIKPAECTTLLKRGKLIPATLDDIARCRGK